MDRAVVLVALGVPGVEEAGTIRLPGDAAGPGVGDRLAEVTSVAHVEDAQHRILRATLTRADGDEPAVVGDLEPVDGVRRISGAGSGIDEDVRRGVAIDGGAQRQSGLLGTGGSFEGDQLLAAHLGRHGDR